MGHEPHWLRPYQTRSLPPTKAITDAVKRNEEQARSKADREEQADSARRALIERRAGALEKDPTAVTIFREILAKVRAHYRDELTTGDEGPDLFRAQGALQALTLVNQNLDRMEILRQTRSP